MWVTLRSSLVAYFSPPTLGAVARKMLPVKEPIIMTHKIHAGSDSATLSPLRFYKEYV